MLHKHNFNISHKNTHSESNPRKTVDGEAGKSLEQNYFLCIHWYLQQCIIQTWSIVNNDGNQ